ncbi:MAG TPA: GMC family oxidoreductase N-terminal domain-containing protein [Afifellaceae bacterium]|nr:GMC family oxidoreductase N-terminal domain-containing protein [Afifellaceae bacterium]
MEFDYVIVGAGSAGCVLANRLSANPSLRVALLEAGGRDWYPWIHIPVGYFKTMNNPSWDWCLRTEPDPGLNGRSIRWPRGKVLGGSSSINGLLYVRGQPNDYDVWAQMGNRGWSWSDVEPYFRKAECGVDTGDDVLGTDGPLAISRPRLQSGICDAWVAAAVKSGYRRNPNYNGGDQEGVGHFFQTARDGLRASTARAFLKPVRNRPNLVVLTEHRARHLVIDEGRANGIVCAHGDDERTIIARREIILSAGAIGSPQILMLSGIGEADHLRDLGITARVDLPGVGGNLQDHLQARPIFKCRSATLNDQVNSLIGRMTIALEFATRRTGPMTMAASLGVGFMKTRPELETPDIQFHVQPFSAGTDMKPHKFSAFTASVCQLRPESRGRIRLKSPDPDEPPQIHPGYLSSEIDCRTMVEGVKIARRIAAAEPLKSEITAEHAPGPDVCSDDKVLDWIRNTATTIYHPSGTCKMGKDSDAVVDDRLRLRGLDGLRVADASIMPNLVSGNTNGPTIMIAEKAADMILEDAR